MKKYTLPTEIGGDWIWGDTNGVNSNVESFMLFRKEFSLTETPALAELWISCRSIFHLYVNEQYLSIGPGPSINGKSYVQFHDITFLLQTGRNVIAIMGYNTNVSRYGFQKQANGFWCHMETDNKKKFTSDKTWKYSPATHFLKNQPRISSALGFVEKQDLRNFNPLWNCISLEKQRHYGDDINFKDTSQHSQAWNSAVSQGPCSAEELKILKLPELNISRVNFQTISAKGSASQKGTSSCVEFSSKFTKAGVYTSHSYIYCRESSTQSVFIHCDDSFKVFINGKMIKSQGKDRTYNGLDPSWSNPMTYLQNGEQVDPASQIELNSGWNEITLITYVGKYSAGLTVNFPEIRMGDMKFLQSRDESGTPGWRIAGPLKIPFVNLSGMLDFESLAPSSFLSVEPCDVASYLMTYEFKKESETSEDAAFIELHNQKYVMLDLGRTMNGCPEFTVLGKRNDIIDIIYGEIYDDGKLMPIQINGKKVDTIILGDEEITWRSCNKRAFRYMLVFVRKSTESCYIKNAGIRIIDIDNELKGKFSSSEDLLTKIWNISSNTLSACTDHSFCDTPAGDNCQYISDATIEGITSLQTLGIPEFSEKALREFADSQFETGEMPGACPSDMYFNIPDYPMLWVIWLQKHILYTDNSEFLEEMLLPLEKLFDYYDSLSLSDSSLLGGNLGHFSFLDHGDIDRRGIVTGLNALYCRALLNGQWLLKYLKKDEAASILQKRAGKVAANLRSLTWNEEKGLFADCWVDGEKSSSYSFQTNILCLYGAVPTAEKYDEIFNTIFIEEEPYFNLPVGELLNPFFNFYILETAFSLNKREWALNFMKWYWGGMIENGATSWWEFYNPLTEYNPEPTASLCHGYGVIPNVYLISEIAGIRPSVPGFSQVIFNPLLSSANSIKATIPTPHGRIIVEWEKKSNGELEISLDSNYPLDILPQLPKGTEVTLHVSEDINILQ